MSTNTYHIYIRGIWIISIRMTFYPISIYWLANFMISFLLITFIDCLGNSHQALWSCSSPNHPCPSPFPDDLPIHKRGPFWVVHIFLDHDQIPSGNLCLSLSVSMSEIISWGEPFWGQWREGLAHPSGRGGAHLWQGVRWQQRQQQRLQW